MFVALASPPCTPSPKEKCIGLGFQREDHGGGKQKQHPKLETGSSFPDPSVRVSKPRLILSYPILLYPIGTMAETFGASTPFVSLNVGSTRVNIQMGGHIEIIGSREVEITGARITLRGKMAQEMQGGAGSSPSKNKKSQTTTDSEEPPAKVHATTKADDNINDGFTIVPGKVDDGFTKVTQKVGKAKRGFTEVPGEVGEANGITLYMRLEKHPHTHQLKTHAASTCGTLKDKLVDILHFEDIKDVDVDNLCKLNLCMKAWREIEVEAQKRKRKAGAAGNNAKGRETKGTEDPPF